MTKTWLEANTELLKLFSLTPGDDQRDSDNLAYKELDNMLVFVTRPLDAKAHNVVNYHGFDSLKKGLDVLVGDMVDSAYFGSKVHERYHMIPGNEIVATFFKGKVVRLHPVVTSVAVLIPDPRCDGSTAAIKFEDFDTFAGSIEYRNLEVIDNERSESESTEESSTSDNSGLGEQGELFDTEASDGETGS